MEFRPDADVGISVDPPALRPLTGGAVMAGMSRASVALTGAVTTILIARLLGPSGAGAYAIAQTLILLLTVGATLGIEHGITYYVSSGRWNASDAFRDAQRLALVSGLLGTVAALLARALVPAAFHGLSLAMTAIAAAALPFSLSWFYGTYISLATDRYERFVVPAAVQSGLAMCLVAVLASIDGVPGAVVGLTAAHVVTAVGAFIIARPRSEYGQAHADERRESGLPRAMSFGIKGYAANALQFVNYRLDLFILNATAARATVGHYAIAVSVTSVMWLLPAALGDVLFPRVATLSSRSGDHHERMLRFAEAKGLRHAALITIAATVMIVVILLLLVTPVYGSAFGQATVLGLIMLPGVALLAIANPLSAMVVGRGHPGLLLASAAIVTPLTTALYLLLIPSLHAPGAALASAISYTSTFVLAAIFYQRVTGFNPLRLMVPTRAELGDYRALWPTVVGRIRSTRETDAG